MYVCVTTGAFVAFFIRLASAVATPGVYAETPDQACTKCSGRHRHAQKKQQPHLQTPLPFLSSCVGPHTKNFILDTRARQAIARVSPLHHATRAPARRAGPAARPDQRPWVERGGRARGPRPHERPFRAPALEVHCRHNSHCGQLPHARMEGHRHCQGTPGRPDRAQLAEPAGRVERLCQG